MSWGAHKGSSSGAPCKKTNKKAAFRTKELKLGSFFGKQSFYLLPKGDSASFHLYAKSSFSLLLKLETHLKK